ncbi:MAG: EamA family transporter [Deltaproteobacteria bacterium]|nr:EamA family transporter [Deltaproteobacteria bacterium]MDZ4224891.1 EamA family transporter [bacterium]
MIKSFIVLCMAMLFAGIGNIFFGKGMKKIGALDRYHPKSVAIFFGRAIINGYIWLGIVMSTLYFFLWLVVLSWADVSWALPMNGVEYVFVAAASVFYLKEKLDVNRIIGIGLIVLGVIFLMQSWSGHV